MCVTLCDATFVSSCDIYGNHMWRMVLSWTSEWSGERCVCLYTPQHDQIQKLDKWLSVRTWTEKITAVTLVRWWYSWGKTDDASEETFAKMNFDSVTDIKLFISFPSLSNLLYFLWPGTPWASLHPTIKRLRSGATLSNRKNISCSCFFIFPDNKQYVANQTPPPLILKSEFSTITERTDKNRQTWRPNLLRREWHSFEQRPVPSVPRVRLNLCRLFFLIKGSLAFETETSCDVFMSSSCLATSKPPRTQTFPFIQQDHAVSGNRFTMLQQQAGDNM